MFKGTHLTIWYSVSIITYQLGTVLHANKGMAGDDRGPFEVLRQITLGFKVKLDLKNIAKA